MEEIYIDASEQVMGRLASKIARELLKGNKVYVINAEKSMISGDPKHVLKTYQEKINRGDPYHGPFSPKTSEIIFKRVVRGMLPKKARGREALKGLRVFRSRLESFEGKEFKKFEETKIKRDQSYMDLGKLSKKLGARSR
ncbi:MAG: 50S ribosomal protein L13 [Candidatus Aenigmatarchaeota archaeon]|nr:MAG: 50S ribosomal protein L13 [Candidatus Aenigmarchaeota archaeon]